MIATYYNRHKVQIKGWTKIFYQFTFGQGLLQVSNLVVGIFLLRWLTKDQYAQYSMAFAFQSTAQMFIEFGFSSAVIALVGKRIHEKETVGMYIAAGKSYRSKTYLLISSMCCLLFPYLAYQQHWSPVVIVLLLISILSNLFFSGWVSYYKPALQIHKKITSVYKLEVSTSIARGIVLFIIHSLVGLYSWIATMVAAVMLTVNGIFYRKMAKPYVAEPEKPSYEAKKEMLRYITPIIPGIIFSSFQSQITLFLISIFGKSNAIAEVGALSRLSQLFTFLNIASSMLIVPVIARQPERQLLKKYLIILTGAVIVVSVLCIWGYTLPHLFLLILGKQYSNLDKEVGLVVLNASITFLVGLLWGMNSSRKWLFSWMPIVSIPGQVLITIWGISFLDLSKTHNVILLSTIDSVFVLLTRINTSYWGFKKYVYGKN